VTITTAVALAFVAMLMSAIMKPDLGWLGERMAGGILCLTVCLLPASQRARWHQEWRAELDLVQQRYPGILWVLHLMPAALRLRAISTWHVLQQDDQNTARMVDQQSWAPEDLHMAIVLVLLLMMMLQLVGHARRRARPVRSLDKQSQQEVADVGVRFVVSSDSAATAESAIVTQGIRRELPGRRTPSRIIVPPSDTTGESDAPHGR
jgi:hypothetical protein